MNIPEWLDERTKEAEEELKNWPNERREEFSVLCERESRNPEPIFAGLPVP